LISIMIFIFWNCFIFSQADLRLATRRPEIGESESRPNLKLKLKSERSLFWAGTKFIIEFILAVYVCVFVGVCVCLCHDYFFT
jgi:hypothetical protein